MERNMKLFKKSKKKNEEETDEEINCDVCGVTLKSYQKSEHKKLCEECFSKINED
jgi:protein-arginine kinase activator protein McsA